MAGNPGARESIPRVITEFVRISRIPALGLTAGIFALFLLRTLPIFAVLPGGLGGPSAPLVVLLPVVMSVPFYFLSMQKARMARKAIPVLQSLAGLSEMEVRGRDLVCMVLHPDPSVPPLTLRIQSFAEEVGFGLELPWEPPGGCDRLRETLVQRSPGADG